MADKKQKTMLYFVSYGSTQGGIFKVYNKVTTRHPLEWHNLQKENGMNYRLISWQALTEKEWSMVDPDLRKTKMNQILSDRKCIFGEVVCQVNGVDFDCGNLTITHEHHQMDIPLSYVKVNYED